jgi:hypothetical protein
MSQRITITITKKIATCLTELPIVCGNSDYECEFLFDGEWDKHSVKTARFRFDGKYTDVVFEGTVCNMPIISNAKIVWVGVFAGELSTSSPAMVHCKPSILDGGDVPAPPREDVYSQMISLCNDAVSTVRNLEEKANTMTTDIATALESIIAIQENLIGGETDDTVVNEITFTVIGITFHATEGMTWREFVESEYNRYGYFIRSDYVLCNRHGELGGIAIINEDASYVLSTDIIRDGASYSHE